MPMCKRPKSEPLWCRGLTTALLCSVALPTSSAEVTYTHPSLSIVAENEPLETVLIDLGKAMKISVSTPLGYNPHVSCSTGEQSIAQSLRALLRDTNYILEWEPEGGRLSALVIYGGIDAESENRAGMDTDAALGGGLVSIGKEVRVTEQQARHRATQAEQETRSQETQLSNEARDREARLEEEARIRREEHEYELRERALYAAGSPDT